MCWRDSINQDRSIFNGVTSVELLSRRIKLNVRIDALTNPIPMAFSRWWVVAYLPRFASSLRHQRVFVGTSRCTVCAACDNCIDAIREIPWWVSSVLYLWRLLLASKRFGILKARVHGPEAVCSGYVEQFLREKAGSRIWQGEGKNQMEKKEKEGKRTGEDRSRMTRYRLDSRVRCSRWKQRETRTASGATRGAVGGRHSRMKHSSPNTVCSFRVAGPCNLFANPGYCGTTGSSCRSVGQPSVVVNKYFVPRVVLFPGIHESSTDIHWRISRRVLDTRFQQPVLSSSAQQIHISFFAPPRND